ncbi:MAG: hypothetical protein IPP45_19345 [Sphingomonadales bacterium]|nr:hypothetical protein [Sphingomonadales bacterium]
MKPRFALYDGFLAWQLAGERDAPSQADPAAEQETRGVLAPSTRNQIQLAIKIVLPLL